MNSLKKYCNKFRINKILHRMRYIIYRPVTIAEDFSDISGKIVVFDVGNKRYLQIDKYVHSFIDLHGKLKEINREYWGKISEIPFETSIGGDLLMLGLGGGAALAPLMKKLRPNSITVVEYDPVIIKIAKEYFFIDTKQVKIINDSAINIIHILKILNQRFHIIIDDVFNDEEQKSFPEQIEIIKGIKNYIQPGGTLILNRAVNNDDEAVKIERFADDIERIGFKVKVRTIRQIWWNKLIYCRMNINTV